MPPHYAPSLREGQNSLCVFMNTAPFLLRPSGSFLMPIVRQQKKRRCCNIYVLANIPDGTYTIGCRPIMLPIYYYTARNDNSNPKPPLISIQHCSIKRNTFCCRPIYHLFISIQHCSIKRGAHLLFIIFAVLFQFNIVRLRVHKFWCFLKLQLNFNSTLFD